MRSSIRYIILPALVALVIFYVTCLVSVDSIPVPKKYLYYDKLAHFGMFFTLSAAIYLDYYWLQRRKPNKYRLLFLGLLVPVVYGGVIEIVQHHFFNRTGDWFDFYADALGSLSATLLVFIYIRVKRKQ